MTNDGDENLINDIVQIMTDYIMLFVTGESGEIFAYTDLYTFYICLCTNLLNFDSTDRVTSNDVTRSHTMFVNLIFKFLLFHLYIQNWCDMLSMEFVFQFKSIPTMTL